MRAALSTRHLALALLFACFVPLFWLNQSVGGADWEAYRDRVKANLSANVVETLRYPTSFLYRRSGDEEIYFATANATLGRPYNARILASRGKSSLPPVETPADGRFHTPYTEVPLEYLPLNFPFVVAPALIAHEFRHYARLFGALMGLVLLAAAALAIHAAPRPAAEARARDLSLRAVLFGLLLLAHGAISIQRLDALVALGVAAMLFAAVRRRWVLLGVCAGLVFATKLVPALVVVPLFLATGDVHARSLGRVALGGVLGTAIGLLPLFATPSALPMLLAYHGERALHVESCLGVLYGIGRLIAGRGAEAAMDYGSYNFHGVVADALAKASVPLTLALVAAAALSAWTGAKAPRDEPRRTLDLVVATLAGLVALWLGGKVFSPQYLTWALPAVLAAPHVYAPPPRAKGLGALVARVRASPLSALTFLLALVVGLSQLYLRAFYDHVYRQWPVGVATMSVRLAVLVFLFAWLLRRPEGAASEAAS